MTADSHISVVVNPRAAAGAGARSAKRALAALAGLKLEIQYTTGPDVRDVFERAVANDPAALVVCGGDGMVHAALSVLAGGSIPLGLVPAGTGNDFARELGIPLGDPAAAARLVRTGKATPIDLAKAGDAWFGSVLSSGFDARVNARTNRMSWPRGRSRYVVATFAEISTFRPMDFRIEVDGVAREFAAMAVAVGNTASYGGGMRICPAAVPDDGELDVTVVSAVSRFELLRMFSTVYKGQHIHHPAVTTLRGRHIRIESADAHGYADGEPVGSLPLEITTHPDAIEVFRP